LTFAGRATASFPGAFPPARIVEIDEVVARKRADWPKREAFIARSFPHHLAAGIDPTTASFIDGAVLNNRPFQQAIAAIQGRPAYRQVDRRLIYIEPHPVLPLTGARRRTPGFFAMLRGAMSDIPSSQPVTDELNRVIEFNERVRRLRAVIASARPQISGLVAKVIPARIEGLIAESELRHWREGVNARVAQDAGFAYQAYLRLKLASVRTFAAQLIVKLRGSPEQSPLSRLVTEIIDVWAIKRGIAPKAARGEAVGFKTEAAGKLPLWVKYLLAFDLKYRERRLHFLIEGQNRLYDMLDQDHFAAFDPRVMDGLKRALYSRLEDLRRREDAAYYGQGVRELVRQLLPAPPSANAMRNVRTYAREFVERECSSIDRLVEQMAEEIDLDRSTRDLDQLLSALDPAEWHPKARREILVNYLGFPFWDVLTFPMTGTQELGELNEILVDRISPRDARALKGFVGIESLKGVGFGHFAAFFSRAFRENDYLLGRLHAVDRLIDIVCDSAGPEATSMLDLAALKSRAFMQVLDAEEKHLPQSNDLIAALRRSVAQMTSSGAKEE
jgi:patatin-related protein